MIQRPFRPAPYDWRMLITNSTAKTWTKSSNAAPLAPTQKTPFEMDRFELQDKIHDADGALRALKYKENSGKQTAMAGMGVLFTSLGLTTAQSIAAGAGGLPPSLSIPLAVSTAVGLTIFVKGILDVDKAASAQTFATSDARDLQALYARRFGEDRFGA